MKTIITSICAAALLAGGVAQGQVILDFDFTGAPGNQVSTSGTPTGAGVGVISNAIIDRGSGLNPASASNSISSNGWDDLSPNDYFSIRFDIASGNAINFQTLSLSTRSSSSGPGFLSVYSSLDSFSTALFSFTQPGTSTVTANYNISTLTGVTGSVEFRIIADNTTSAGGGTIGSTGTFRINSASFEGSVIPEPSTALLLTLGMGVLAVVRRRKLMTA